MIKLSRYLNKYIYKEKSKFILKSQFGRSPREKGNVQMIQGNSEGVSFTRIHFPNIYPPGTPIVAGLDQFTGGKCLANCRVFLFL
jgi:hypothetical protein